jgi:hypothetical protein
VPVAGSVGEGAEEGQGITLDLMVARVGVGVDLVMACGGGRRCRPLELLLRRGRGSAGSMCIGPGSKGY